MKKVLILAGPSGAGKSTYAKKARALTANSACCSADNYMVDHKGVYNFDFKRLSEVHTKCFKKALQCLNTGVNLVIIDNTNTTAAEISPYVALARAFDYKVSLLAFLPKEESFDKLAKRQRHGVPIETIKRQSSRLEATLREYRRVPVTIIEV